MQLTDLWRVGLLDGFQVYPCPRCNDFNLIMKFECQDIPHVPQDFPLDRLKDVSEEEQATWNQIHEEGYWVECVACGPWSRPLDASKHDAIDYWNYDKFSREGLPPEGQELGSADGTKTGELQLNEYLNSFICSGMGGFLMFTPDNEKPKKAENFLVYLRRKKTIEQKHNFGDDKQHAQRDGVIAFMERWTRAPAPDRDEIMGMMKGLQ